MQDGSRRAIIAAFLANLGIAVAKFVGFAVTGASSMLAEAIHSCADSGNQGLLLLGGARGSRKATPEHPFGYGRERYFWAFVVAVVLFAVGALFSVHEGIDKLRHPHDLASPMWAVGILAVAILLESWSLRTAVQAARPQRKGRSWWNFIKTTKSAELPVVLLEDLGALVGLVLALGGIGMAMITGNSSWDALGTLAIGILLGIISVILAIKMKSLLIGESAGPDERAAILAAFESTPEVKSVIHLKTLHLGPDELLVAAKVDMNPALDFAGVIQAIDAAEQRVREAVPSARVCYVEPDRRREET